MSDRHTVQESFNVLLKNYHQETLPNVIEGWDTLGESEKSTILRLNDNFVVFTMLLF